MEIKINNHRVKPTIQKLSEINNDIPSNDELLAETVQDLFDLIKERSSLPSWTTKEESIERCLDLMADLLQDLCPPTNEQIRKDNPHFGPAIRIVEDITQYDGQFTERFSHVITMGARNSKIDADMPNMQKIVDAWATYLWDYKKKEWCLGAN